MIRDGSADGAPQDRIIQETGVGRGNGKGRRVLGRDFPGGKQKAHHPKSSEKDDQCLPG